MKKETRINVVGLLALIACAACAKPDTKETHAAPSTAHAQPAPKAAPAAKPAQPMPAAADTAMLQAGDVNGVPTQAAADAAAAKKIDKANADAELEKLRDELGGG